MRYLAFISGLIFSVVACAEDAPAPNAEKYEEGKHYLVLSAPVQTIVPKDKVEITEVFRFGCPHCYHFEESASKWKKTKPEAAELVRNPVVWDKVTETRARVYYTGEKLGVADETALKIFKAIHEEARTAREANTVLTKEDDILAMFESLGVEREKAKKMYNNWFVSAKVNQADGRARGFAVAGTPEIFVDGRYRITTTTAGGSYETMLDIAAFLVNKIAAERGTEAPVETALAE